MRSSKNSKVCVDMWQLSCLTKHDNTLATKIRILMYPHPNSILFHYMAHFRLQQWLLMSLYRHYWCKICSTCMYRLRHWPQTPSHFLSAPPWETAVSHEHVYCVRRQIGFGATNDIFQITVSCQAKPDTDGVAQNAPGCWTDVTSAFDKTIYPKAQMLNGGNPTKMIFHQFQVLRTCALLADECCVAGVTDKY